MLVVEMLTVDLSVILLAVTLEMELDQKLDIE